MLGTKAVVIFGSVAAGLAALVFSGKTASAAPGGGAPAPAPGGGSLVPPSVPLPTLPDASVPQAISDEIATALLTADPAKMRAAADDIEKKGFKPQADDLRAVATQIENAIKIAPLSPAVPPTVAAPSIPVPPVVPPGPGSPPIVLPPLVIPGTPPVVLSPPVVQPPGAPNPQQQLAAQVALHLASVTRGKENKGLVTAFEQQEDAAGFIPDHDTRGLYGPHDALALAHHWGIIPPVPFYWPHNATPAKNSYMAAINAMAVQDPARAAQWAQAANAARFS